MKSTLRAPDKILSLHIGEEELRKLSVQIISDDGDLTEHLHMIEQIMDLIHALLPTSDVKDQDQLQLGNLGIRCFNALAASLKLMLSGYYQAAALHIRDLLETTFLLDYFTTDPGLVTQWRTMSSRDRKKAFKPITVRDALDKRDGFTTMKRKAAYELLCKLAGHATPEGAVLLSPDPMLGSVHCGPFIERQALEGVLSEAALTATQCGQAFGQLMTSRTLEAFEARASFLHDAALWQRHFFGKEPDHASLAEVRRILDIVRQMRAADAGRSAAPNDNSV